MLAGGNAEGCSFRWRVRQLRRTLNGSEDRQKLLAEWAERWRDRLLMAAIARVGDRDRAEDTVQEALVRALAVAISDPVALDEVKNPYAWLAGIVRNVTRDASRKQGRRERILRDKEAEVRAELHPCPDPAWDVAWLCEIVAVAADRYLGSKQRRIVVAMLDGKSDARIAREEGVARSTVRWHRREAARALRGHLVGRG